MGRSWGLLLRRLFFSPEYISSSISPCLHTLLLTRAKGRYVQFTVKATGSVARTSRKNISSPRMPHLVKLFTIFLLFSFCNFPYNVTTKRDKTSQKMLPMIGRKMEGRYYTELQTLFSSDFYYLVFNELTRSTSMN